MRTTKYRLTAALMALALLGVLGPPACAAEDTEEDKTFIVVQKTFAGIRDHSLVSDDFYLTIQSKGDSSVSHTLTPIGVDDDDSKKPIPSIDADGNIVWKWQVPVPAGTYLINEFNADIDNYTWHDPGKFEVTTSLTIEPIKNLPIQDLPTFSGSGNDKEAFIGKNLQLIFFEVQINGNNSVWFVWSETALGESQRAAMSDALAKLKNPPAVLPIHFFSGDKIENGDGLNFGNATIHYDKNTGMLTCSRSLTNGHNLFGYGSNIFGNGDDSGNVITQNAEIEIVNTYSPYITVSKTLTGTGADLSQKFHFVVTDTSTNAEITAFSLGHRETKDDILIPYGHTVTIEETDADGYSTTVRVDDDAAKVIRDSNFPYRFQVTVTAPTTLDFVNKLDAPPDMGITLDALPYALILLGVGAAAPVLLPRKRRRDGDDGEEW